MCLDWIGQGADEAREEAAPYYARANYLDPNGSFTTVNTGWHYVQTGDYAAARTWFERARQLEGAKSSLASQYLPIVEQRLMENAGKHK
jgi:Flp pilus assembly protein TadD